MAQQATIPANQQTARGKQTAGNQQKVSTQRSTGGRYFGALIFVVTVFQIPLLAALLTVVVYLVPADSLARIDPYQLGTIMIALLLGFIIALFLWLLLALFCMSFATAAGGQALSYDSLKIELDVLKARHEIVKGVDTYDTLTEQEKASLTEDDRARYIALADIDENISSIEQTLLSYGLQWVLGTGYTSLWKRIYRVKEAMVGLLPSTTLVDDAKYDDSRLQDSDIPDHDNLLALLQNAIVTLSSPSPPQMQLSPTHSLQQQLSQQTEVQARTDIRKVSYVIHKFNSERWEGLLRTRNQLMQTALFTGIITYLLLVTAITAGVSPDKIRQVILFYFLGVIVGVFSRLNNEMNQTDTVDSDYGLTMSRVIVTPLLSGLAAVVGVFLVSIVLTGLITTSTTTHGQNLPGIGSIYDFTVYPQNLVFAAIFGFLPNLVINVLQQKSQDVISQINSSSAANTSTSSDRATRGSRGTGGSRKNPMGTGPLSSLTGQLSTGTGLLPPGPAPSQANGGDAGPLDGKSASG